MNTFHDLESEFADLAAQAPSEDSVRDTLAYAVARREKHRRTTALVAVAAAVVLVAGGIGITGAVLKSDPSTARPAAPNAVVPVPDVPLPADTQLIRHQLPPVVSPVTATPPEGLGGKTWTQSPDRLSVSWFDTRAAANGNAIAAAGAYGSDDVKTAGYAITDTADDLLRVISQDGVKNVDASRRPARVGDRAVTLESAPSGATDILGFPAAERLSWQLPDGRYIHVWTSGLPTRLSSPDSALVAFAETVRDEPAPLIRTIGLGLTLPGMTVDSTMNLSPIAGYVGGSLILCRPGIDPYGMASTGNPSSGDSVASGETRAAAPDTGESDTYQGDFVAGGSPAAPCLTVAVINDAGAKLGREQYTRITVGGIQVSVSADDQTAMVDLGKGLVAGIGTPASAKLSRADLAALAASVRVSADIAVIPLDTSRGSSDSGSASASSSAMALPLPSGEAAMAMPLEVVAGSTATSVDRDSKSVEIEVSVHNRGPASVNAAKVTATAPGWRLDATKARLANVPSDNGQPFADATFPLMFTPGTTVRLQLAFTIEDCTAAADGDGAIDLEYSVTANSPAGVNLAAGLASDAGTTMISLASAACR